MEKIKIPLCKPFISEKEIELVKEVLESGWLAHGPKNKEFEEAFSAYIGTKKAISVNSCTSALHLAIQAMNIKGEVILPGFTFVASSNSIITAGAKPVFCDIEYDTCNLDPEDVRKKISPETEAIMPVHFAGHPCRMDEIMEIAEEHDLKVIEDSAETLGGTFEGRKTGSIGDVGCFSFYPTKNITTGEGGMVTLNDEGLAAKIAALRAHGVLSSTFEREKLQEPWLRAASYAGYNFRLCDVLAAIGLVQMSKLEEMNDLRRKHSVYLNKNLNHDRIDLPVELEKCRHVYQMYTIKVKDIDRTKFILQLREKGIGASVHFDPPVHLQPYYKGFNCKLPVTEKVSKSIVTLPMFPGLTKEELDYILNCIDNVLHEPE
ncbi:DegT/DnrJ/EryC1/StrS family aminotransferase [Candidatus Woesearchaeota archaeon]|nr:DegT/DnrJ/EryC1/StrS family aminotransferase [Candidatus Woesearchaeota archaeon]